MSELGRQAIVQNTQGCSEEDLKIMLKVIPAQYIVEEILSRLEELERLKKAGMELFGV